jgi:hypothetical protein
MIRFRPKIESVYIDVHHANLRTSWSTEGVEIAGEGSAPGRIEAARNVASCCNNEASAMNPTSMTELAQARETTAELLEELGLESYLFAIEPRDDQWELKVDCVADQQGTWETVVVPVDKTALLACHQNTAERQRVLVEWRMRLADCMVRKS